MTDQCIPSAEYDDDAAILAEAGWFHGITVITDGSNAVTVDIYDNASAASGTKLIPTATITTSATDRIQTINPPKRIRVKNGIYVNVTCSGTVGYMVYYET